MQDVMGHSFIMNYGHLVFHTGRINVRKEELPRLHAKTTTAAEMEELAAMCEALGLPHAEAPAPRLERGAFLR